MIRWIPYTFVRTVIFFIGGIIFGFHAPDILPKTTVFVTISSLAIVYFATVLARRIWHKAFNPGWNGLLLVFVFGYAHILLQTESRWPQHILHVNEPITYYRAIVTRFAEEKARSWKLEARVDGIRTSAWRAGEGRIVLYFAKTDFPRPFQYGDVLLIKGTPQRPQPAANPGEFDYQNYLALRNIYHQHFLYRDDVIKTAHKPDNVFHSFAYRARNSAQKILNRFVHGDREEAIASALVLGVTDGLDNELLEAYSATGTMHILAVSGLHVSIIYIILLRLFSPLGKFAKGRWAVAFISLAILWLYAFITGLTPSVLRAVMMFSFLAIARPWARSTNIYNTLAVSAFCLLLYDPALIFSVGFQLSYLAVLGIVYIYPKILRLWEPQHWITVEIWKLSAVSIAAQLATFPLGLLYFNQFPNYFLISNLLVVPLSFVVLIVGLAMLVASFVSVVASALGVCLVWVIRFLNGVVFTLDDLPFAVTDHVFVTVWQSILLLILIVFILALFEHKRFKYVVYCFAVVTAIAGLQWLHFHRDINIRKITVYKVPGHSAIDLIDKGQTFFVTDDRLRSDLRKIRFHISPNRIISGIRKEVVHENVHEFAGGRLIVWNGVRILQLTGINFKVPQGIAADWLVVANNAVSDVGKIKDSIRCGMIILDSSNSFFFASRFLEAAKLYKLEVHSVLHQGAFDKKIEKRHT